MPKKSVIYQTHGRAAEYCPLAINLYYGCAHGCRYCYSADVTKQDPARYFNPAEVRARVTPEDISRSAEETAGKDISMREIGKRQPVLLCFICDPYQPREAVEKLTREAFIRLHAWDFPVTVLTKAGALARRDFDLYRPGDSFATTLTFLDEERSRKWEPRAALPDERLQNLMLAKQAGIETWVSLEPVIDTAETIAIIYGTHQWVDHYKVGKLNYMPEAKREDWASFGGMVMATLRLMKKGFYIKRDLGAFIGYSEGYREGRQLP